MESNKVTEHRCRFEESLMYAVYAIKSLSSNRIYFGQTNNIERRMEEHNSKMVKSTKANALWELIAVEMFPLRGEAMWMEKSLKNSHDKRNRWLQKNQV